MIFYKNILLSIVALLNIYCFAFWIIAFNRYQTHPERVNFFLRGWPMINSVGALNILLSSATLAAVIAINVNTRNNQVFRLLLSIIYILFLLLTAWSYL